MSNRRHTFILIACRLCLVALIGSPLMFLSGCVATKAQVRSKPTCSRCQCGSCGSSHAVSTGEHTPSDQPSPNQADAGHLSYDTHLEEFSPLALPRPVPPAPVPAECEPQELIATPDEPICDEEAREECTQLQAQTEFLRQRLLQLEARLTDEQTEQQALRQSLGTVNSKVTVLSSELGYWKQEVQRIDAEAEQQHQDDLESLQAISELISRLPRPTTAAGPETPRQ